MEFWRKASAKAVWMWQCVVAVATIAVSSSSAAQPPCEPGWETSVPVPGMNSVVQAMAVYDDGGGSALYVGGLFTATDDGAAERIARWNGSTWEPVGTGVNNDGGVASIKAMTVFNDGSGSALYVGGAFSAAGEVPAEGVAKWNGQAWSPVGDGMPRSVNGLAVFDDGTGAALYAATSLEFAESGGVWMFDGSSWSVVGGGITSSFGASDIYALAVFDDGNGNALYAGGSFDAAGGTPSLFIAKWDGATWSSVGGGMNEPVFALHAHDDGGGPALFAGGSFLEAGGDEALAIAKWDGVQWLSLGNQDPLAVFALAEFDDGFGTALYAAGLNGFGPRQLYRWDGDLWAAVASDITGSEVRALQASYSEDIPVLYVGGDFSQVGPLNAHNLARWNGCATDAGVVPTVSDWGLLIMAGIIVGVGAHMVHRRRTGCDQPQMRTANRSPSQSVID